MNILLSSIGFFLEQFDVLFNRCSFTLRGSDTKLMSFFTFTVTHDTLGCYCSDEILCWVIVS